MSALQDLGVQVAEINYCGYCDGLCEDCQKQAKKAVEAFKNAWQAADEAGLVGHRVEIGLAAAFKAAQDMEEDES